MQAYENLRKVVTGFANSTNAGMLERNGVCIFEELVKNMFSFILAKSDDVQ